MFLLIVFTAYPSNSKYPVSSSYISIPNDQGSAFFLSYEENNAREDTIESV